MQAGVRQRPELRAEIARGLASSPRSLPCRFFYDEEGARLFEEITRLEEYYPTAAEIEILTERVKAVADIAGPRTRVVEYGSGSGDKTLILLDGLHDPAVYLPVDVARRQLLDFAARVSSRYPDLEVRPVAADYTRLETLPWPETSAGSNLAFFPGSTVGNFEPNGAVRFLKKVARQIGQGGLLLIGVDLVKDPSVLERAYNDAAGVTARFNLNILTHLSRLLGASFDPARFRHRAIWNERESRIEMHLVSEERQEVALGPDPDAPRFMLEEGEAIVTEHSYKYESTHFREIAVRAGFEPVEAWTDSRGWFALHLLRVGA